MAWHSTSRQARGYGAQWDRLRLVVLARDCYLCQCDACKGGALRVRSATQVDHRVPKAQGGSDDMENLRAINADCHRRVTLEQQGKQARLAPDQSWAAGAGAGRKSRASVVQDRPASFSTLEP